jgi:hypothetical protein
LAETRLAERFKNGQDYIFTDDASVPAGYKQHKVHMTDPANPRPGRNFYAERLGKGDVPNLRVALRLASDLARIDRLDVNDPDFIRLKQRLETFLGFTIDNVADFIEAIEAASKNPGRYSLPALARVPSNLVLAAARLASSMIEQSA